MVSLIAGDPNFCVPLRAAFITAINCSKKFELVRSFQQSDFLSYDFDTIRRTMIQYLQNNYPEDFNDYIESSEYIALRSVLKDKFCPR